MGRNNSSFLRKTFLRMALKEQAKESRAMTVAAWIEISRSVCAQCHMAGGFPQSGLPVQGAVSFCVW